MDITQKIKSITIRDDPPNGLDTFLLKFRGYWDDRYEFDGELHFFDLLYYLEDDNIEIIEEIDDDSKTHGITHKKFVKKQKLPKVSRHFVIFLKYLCLPSKNVRCLVSLGQIDL